MCRTGVEKAQVLNELFHRVTPVRSNPWSVWVPLAPEKDRISGARFSHSTQYAPKRHLQQKETSKIG
jgi:hypothetical protein